MLGNRPLIPLTTRPDRGRLPGRGSPHGHNTEYAHAASAFALAAGARARHGEIGAGLIFLSFIVRAEDLVQEHRAARKLEDVAVPHRGVGGIAQTRHIQRVAKHFHNPALPREDHNGVALVGRVPDVARGVERDAVGAFQIGKG
ncbi:MAG: hypothetical protein WD823_07995 [Sulfuricaulis sp.]|uniref:hypothetical protein n=1 Tax=Sulfuricaulis sp. TaxID=2003553 RepID=UPI0034A14A5F